MPGNSHLGESKITEIIINFLSDIPLFNELNKEKLLTIARHMHYLELEKGNLVFEEGEDGDYVCFVASGTLDVIKESKSGERVTITTLAKGRSIGEMAMIDEFPRSATVISNSDTKLITLKRDSFQFLLDNHPDVAIPVLKGITRLVSINLRKTSCKLADLMLPLV